MIREISQEELSSILDLVAKLEMGDHFDENNPTHEVWLFKKISSCFFRGVMFFGCFSDDNELIGFIAVELEEKLDGISWLGQKAEILYIALYPDYQRKGHGSRLLEFVNELCKQQHVHCLYVSTSAFNKDAISFYNKNNYEKVAILPDVHGPNTEGMVCMRKLLT